MLRPSKYAVLLALLLASLAVQSFATSTGSGSILQTVTETVLAVGIYLVVFERATTRRVMAVLLTLNISIAWAHYVPVSSFERALSVTGKIASAIFLWTTVWIILRRLFRTSVFGADDVFGAVCGYLLAGAGWASVNALTYLLAPTTFLIDQKVAPLLVDWHGRNALFAYYTYTQMLTIGYAAVTPLEAPATTLSLFEALFGLFYTAVIVSTLVSMAQSNRKEGAR